MKKISKGFYLGSWLGGIVAFWVLFSIGMASIWMDKPVFGVVLIVLAYIPLIYSVVMMAVLVYKMWAAIQGSGARTTPGMACGFLFIPFFNLYWIFQAFWGWAKDYNKMVRERQLGVPPMPEGLALAASILAVVCGIPYLGLLAVLPYLIVMSIFLAKACDGVNALVDTGGEPQEVTGVTPMAEAPMGEAKTSGLAIGSLVLGILSVVFTCITALPGLILGIVSLSAISKSGGRLKGKGLAIAGIVVSAIFMVMVPILMAILMPALARVRSMAQQMQCGSNLKQVGVAMMVYQNDNNGQYPTPSRWCDLLIETADVSPKTFNCPEQGHGEWSSYAMNKYAERDGAGGPPNMVLVFETNPGWNQCGGPELLTTDGHRGDGCNVLFNDGHVEFVRAKDVASLRWTSSQEESAYLTGAARTERLLQFRIVPNLNEERSPALRREELEKYIEDLLKNGPLAGRKRGDEYLWFPVRNKDDTVWQRPLPQAEYDGRMYLLLCAQRQYSMSPEDGSKWGLKKAYKTTDGMGNRAVGFNFDRAGGERFYELTSANIGNSLAVIVGGEVVSAPNVQSGIREAGQITGNFTALEIDAIVRTLESGMGK